MASFFGLPISRTEGSMSMESVPFRQHRRACCNKAFHARLWTDLLLNRIELDRFCGGRPDDRFVSQRAGANAACGPAKLRSDCAPSRPKPNICLRHPAALLRRQWHEIASESKSIKGARSAAQTNPIACRRHSPTCGRLGLRLQDTAGATRLWAAPAREDACMLIPIAILTQRCLCGAPLAQICQPMHHHAQSCYPTELPNCP